MHPDAAFRESLFDALGDDEGAAFWEGVYGQPVHTYPNTYHNEETGELERMTDEEYAQFVRSKMWEKSREGIEAAKEEHRREKGRDKRRATSEANQNPQTHQSTEEAFAFDFEIQQSLRRGEQRREKKRWKDLWDDYLRRWNDLQILVHEAKRTEDTSERLFLRNKIVWPVESGKRKDVTAEEVERFVTRGTASYVGAEHVQAELLRVLKLERVKWHPDKIQQRFGFMDIDDGTMRGVTAVFQVFDRMWNDLRRPKS